MYTIGQVSEMFNIPVSTLRYYDKEGLFPEMQRKSGIRQFTESDLETLRLIECLKKSDLEIKDIKKFMELCSQGPSTYNSRLQIIQQQKEAVLAEMERLNSSLDMLKYKVWYYTNAILDGNENRVKAMAPDEMPAEIKDAYLNAHRT
ncbi:MAG: MerR family transcriptional regulator [Clostridia bacterium]|nr:MerR family transcriptional regulator [Clostridia bacterium]